MKKDHIIFCFLQVLTLLLIMGCSSTRTYQRVNHIIYPEKRLPDQTGEITVLHTIPLKKAKVSTASPSASTGNDVTIETPNQFGTEEKTGYMVNRIARELKLSKYYLIKERKLTQNEIKLWNNNRVNNYLSSDREVLLILNRLISDYDFKSDKIRKHQLDEAGNDYYIDAYEASRRYVVVADWQIYHSETPDPIYVIRDRGEKTVKTQGLRKDQTIEKLDSIARGTERFLLDSLAKELSHLIMPIKVFDSWSYYVKGSDNLKEGQKYMKLDKLEEAMKLYQSDLRTADDPKIKARLNYNIAIIHDILGDTNLAYQYAGEALLADNKNLHQNLYNKLKIKKERADRS